MRKETISKIRNAIKRDPTVTRRQQKIISNLTDKKIVEDIPQVRISSKTARIMLGGISRSTLNRRMKHDPRYKALDKHKDGQQWFFYPDEIRALCEGEAK